MKNLGVFFGFLALLFHVSLLAEEVRWDLPSSEPSLKLTQNQDEVFTYIERISAGLSPEALRAVKDPRQSFESLNDQFGLPAVLAAIAHRDSSSTLIHDRISETIKDLELPAFDETANPEAQYALPTEASYQAFQKGVSLARSHYLPKESFETLEEAIEAAESHDPTIAKLFAHYNRQLFHLLLTEGRRLETDLTAGEFESQLERNAIRVSLERKGRAELNSVDGVKWQNIRIEGSDLAFVWENAESVHPRSKHSQRIIASQHLVGGKGRTDGQRGRDVIKIRYFWSDSGDLKIESIGFYPRHRFLSKAWIKDFVLYNGTLPSKADVLVLGLPAGLWQAGVASGFDIVNKGQWNWEIAALTFFYGGIYCGVFATNIRRLTNEFSRTDFQRLMANIIVTSLPFALAYKFLYDGAAALNPLSVSGLMVYLGLSIHFWVNNITKVELQGIISDRTNARLNTNGLAGVKRSNLEQTITYNVVSFPARIADLSSFLKFSISQNLNLSSSGGKVWLIGLYPFAKWLKVLHKEYLEEQNPHLRLGAKQARDEWNSSWLNALLGLPVGTGLDLFLAAKSWIAGPSKKSYPPHGDLLDMFRFVFHELRTLERPQDHFLRIRDRWIGLRDFPRTQAQNAKKIATKLAGFGKKTWNGAYWAGEKCAAGLRWLHQGNRQDHYYPPF